MEYGLLLLAVYLIAGSFVLTGKNFISKLVFNVIPFFSGLFLIVYFLIEKGILNI